MDLSEYKIAVIGAGSWGTALALTLARKGLRVFLYGRDTGKIAALRESGLHPDLPGAARAPENLTFSDDAENCLNKATHVIAAVPTQSFRAAFTTLKPFISSKAPILQTAKGMEIATETLSFEMTRAVLPDNPVVILSGPSFAVDLARGLPTAVTLASEETDVAENVARLFIGSPLRPYVNSDAIGASVGGALKNVLALSAGVTIGYGFGDSAKAALLARGFEEMTRYGVTKGAKIETLCGLSGLGDLILTAGSPLSRNFSYGLQVGEAAKTGAPSPETGGKTVEGVFTAEAITRACAHAGPDLPVIRTTADILSGKADIRDAQKLFLERPLKYEKIF